MGSEGQVLRRDGDWEAPGWFGAWSLPGITPMWWACFGNENGLSYSPYASVIHAHFSSAQVKIEFSREGGPALPVQAWVIIRHPSMVELLETIDTLHVHHPSCRYRYKFQA